MYFPETFTTLHSLPSQMQPDQIRSCLVKDDRRERLIRQLQLISSRDVSRSSLLYTLPNSTRSTVILGS
jgi:hypothetical protein